MRYQIQINYRTGDTFGSEDRTNIIHDIHWSDIEVAKRNLQYIKEHYESYMMLQKDWTLSAQQQKKKINEIKNKKWFVGKEDNFYFNINLEKDDGGLQQIGCFWCGYFESLWGAEIIDSSKNINELKYNRIR